MHAQGRISTGLTLSAPGYHLGVIQSHLDLVKGQAAAGFWGQEGVPWPGWGPAGGPQQLGVLSNCFTLGAEAQGGV